MESTCVLPCEQHWYPWSLAPGKEPNLSSERRRRRDALAPCLHIPAPVEDQGAAPGMLPVAEDDSQLMFWVTWIGCRQQPLPASSAQLRDTDPIPTLPSHPPSPPHGPEVPHVPCTNGVAPREVTKGWQGQQLTASILLGPLLMQMSWGRRWMCSGGSSCLQALHQDSQPSGAAKLPLYPCWHQSPPQCHSSECHGLLKPCWMEEQ